MREAEYERKQQEDATRKRSSIILFLLIVLYMIYSNFFGAMINQVNWL